MAKIRNRYTGEVIIEGEGSVKELAEKGSVDLSGVDLSDADLRNANLRNVNLRHTDLRYANLSDADFRYANLRSANLSDVDFRSTDLRSANLRSTNLRSANLSDVDLRSADLRCADLRYADLSDADLRSADLRYANLEFSKFPSIRLLSSITLGQLPTDLTIELMRRGAYAHPHPECFDKWANGEACPYRNEERAWFFTESRELWKPGLPEMTDRELIVEICKAKNWGIEGYFRGKYNKQIAPEGGNDK